MTRREAADLIARYFTLDTERRNGQHENAKELTKIGDRIVAVLSGNLPPSQERWESVAPLRDYIATLYDSMIAYGPPGQFRAALLAQANTLLDSMTEDHIDRSIQPVDPSWTS